MYKTNKFYLKLIFVLVLVAVVAMAFVGCGENATTTDISYELRLNESNSSVSFTEGYVDITSIKIDYYCVETDIVADSSVATLVESFYLDSTMISEADLAKLSTSGTHTVTVTYGDLTLRVAVTIVPEVIVYTYDVTYDAQGGTFSDGSTTKTENLLTISAIPVPTKAGYNFAGWYSNSNYSGTVLITPYELKANTTFYAKWVNENIFAVTYVNQVTNAVISTVEFESGDALTYPTVPTNTGKTFSGWGYYDGSAIDTTTVTANMTIYAFYTVNEYTITIASSEWDEDRTYVVEYGTSFVNTYNAIPFPTKTGYTGYWAIGTTAVTTADLSSVTSDISITAIYTINQYTVTYMIPTDHTEQAEAVNFELYTTKTGNYNTTLGSTPVPSKTGYSTACWMYIENGQYVDATEKLGIGLTESLTVYAIYTVDVYTITFNDGTSDQPELKCEYNSYIDSFTLVDGDGNDRYDTKYYTVEWYSNANKEASSLISFPLLVTSAKTYYYNVVSKPLQVDYVLPDEVDDEALQYAESGLLYTEYVSYGAATNNTIALELVMYDFVGWVDNDGYTAYLKLDDKSEFTGYVTNINDFYEYSEGNALIAILTVKEFTVTFANMIYTDASDTIGFENIAGTSGVPYNSVLYSYDSGLSKDYYLFPNIELDDEYEYEPSYDEESNSSNDDSDWVFDGWYTDTSFINKVDFTTGANCTVTANVTYYAKWVDINKGTEGLEYTLSDDETYYMVTGFNANGATSIDTLYIPSEYNGTPVKGIASYAFVDAMSVSIREIQLSANIEIIEDNAFIGLATLKAITLATDNTEFVVENYVLYNSGKTTLYLYPSGYTDAGLTFTVPSSVVTINAGAFAFTQLSTVDFSENSVLTTIGDNAFYGSTALLSVLKLPTSLTYIGVQAFYSAIQLHSISFATISGLEYVGSGALEKTTWWMTESSKGIITLGGVLLKYTDTTATEYTISDDIVAIAEGAFSNENNYALSLTTIIISANSSLKSIAANAFVGCPHLSSITIETSGVEIDKDAFVGIQSYAKLYVVSSYLNDSDLIEFFGSENIITIVATTTVDDDN
ncbi:MAG: leucine-rich repeat protein [Bacillota bacterium]